MKRPRAKYGFATDRDAVRGRIKRRAKLECRSYVASIRASVEFDGVLKTLRRRGLVHDIGGQPHVTLRDVARAAGVSHMTLYSRMVRLGVAHQRDGNRATYLRSDAARRVYSYRTGDKRGFVNNPKLKQKDKTK